MDIASNPSSWFTRERLLTLTLLAATAGALHLCYLVTLPFMPALIWAAALAVIGYPLHRRIARRIRKPGVAAFASTFLVGVLILAPAIFVVQQIGQQGTQGLRWAQEQLESGEWRKTLEQSPRLKPLVGLLGQYMDVQSGGQKLAEVAQRRSGPFLRGTIEALAQLFISLFVLFYFFRDYDTIGREVRSYMPLSSEETEALIKRIKGMIHATVFGTLVVAAVQGTLGGLLFFALGMPAPVLWGAAMGLMAVIPILGAFVIWVPAAVLLLLQGSVGKAAIMAVFGLLVVSGIDNILYPILVGKDTHAHTVPVFFALLGGVAVFGTAGLVLGPVILAVTVGLLDLWRARTQHGRTADQPIRGKEPALAHS